MKVLDGHEYTLCECTPGADWLVTEPTRRLGNAIDSGIGLSITIDKLRLFINKTLSILSAYQ
jgi:hypothetical protein